MYHYPHWRNPNVLWRKSVVLGRGISKTFQRDEHIEPLATDDTFHAAIAPVLTLSQLFGVFPLQTVLARLPENLTFRRCSVTCLVSALAIFGGYAVSLLSLKRLAQTGGINAINGAEPFFFGVTATSAAMFWPIASQWKSIITVWTKTERVFLRAPFRRILLRTKIRSVATVMLLLAFVEHILSVGNNISNLRREASECNWTITEPFKYFFLKTFSTAFYTFPYSLPIAVYNEYIVISMTFAWNFVDLFIMLMSIGLATRFVQLSTYIRDRIQQPKPTTEQFWEQTRIYYVSLCELVSALNQSISRLIFVSYANDLYFICLQIMNASLDYPFAINKVYFYYSFMFLLLRTFLMFWYSSQVQDKSHETYKLILRVPNEKYCDELQRVQMYSRQGINLTGMGVFLISRRIFLTIAGTIITYELVLLSYQKRSLDESSGPTCEPWQLT